VAFANRDEAENLRDTSECNKPIPQDNPTVKRNSQTNVAGDRGASLRGASAARRS